MSYIVARVVETEEHESIAHGFILPPVDLTERDKNDLDMKLDFEILPFILGVIKKIDDLSEGQALVIYKEIF